MDLDLQIIVPLHQTPKIRGAPLVLVGDAVTCVLSDRGQLLICAILQHNVVIWYYQLNTQLVPRVLPILVLSTLAERNMLTGGG